MSKKPQTDEMADLTPRQRRIMEIIRDAVLLRGYAPSIREIGDAAGLQSTSSVAYQLKALEKKGYLRRDPRKPRAVDVRHLPGEASQKGSLTGARSKKNAAASDVPVGDPESRVETRYVPLVGSIAAGAPIFAEQNIDEFIPLPSPLVGDGELYALQVRGDSMCDAGIFDGDIVIIRQQPVAEKGEIVATMIDGEATIKEFHQDQTGTWLLPHNDSYDPIPGDNATILGRAVTVIRSL